MEQPTLPAQYEKIASLNQLNERKEGEGGKECSGVFQRLFRRKQLSLVLHFQLRCSYQSTAE